MTQVTQNNPVRGSKLVRFLSEYKLGNIEISHKNFAGRLGLLVDLSDSVSLSEALRAIPKMSHKFVSLAAEAQDEGLVEVFLKQRSVVLKSILKSFDAKAVFVQFKLPVPKSDTLIKDAINFDQYQRFYLLHQSELDFKIEKLRSCIRKMMSEQSLGLAQLAELDKTISQSMRVHTRKHFSVVPKILKVRFELLYSEYRETLERTNYVDNPSLWLTEKGWLTQFYAEMQQLLLAEFEVRLQPVIGLVEAYNEEIETQI
ncbi:MAG: hypothetical protein ACI84K_000342 [Pseudohongiellaceae bacterium]|jgi:hypothetical protein